jgi:hypothetical protein
MGFSSSALVVCLGPGALGGAADGREIASPALNAL